VACLLFGIAGAWVMKRIRAGYERKTISDQSLALDSLWLLFAAFYTAILAFAGIGWVILSVAAAVLYQIALRVGRKLTVKNVRHERGPALLILRVFSLGKRSEALFDAVSRHWRYLGSVQLIAGPDLAISTAAPHRFLTFLSGKLRALFVTHRLAIESCLTVLDTERDADGRFRMNDFFCHADTWQRLLSELVSGTDAVLMDLRSFSKTNDGCVFEINELLKHVPLPRLVFLTDATTKQEFLHETFDSGCRRLPEGSPNFGIAASDIQPLNLDSLQYSSLKELLRRLCSAAAWRDVTVVEA